MPEEMKQNNFIILKYIQKLKKNHVEEKKNQYKIYVILIVDANKL